MCYIRCIFYIGQTHEQRGEAKGEQARENAKGKMEEMKGMVKGATGATDNNRV